MKDLSKILPLYGVEQDMILSKMGDITIAYRLELPEIFTLSSAEYEAFQQAWVKALKVLPAGTVLHKQDWYVQEKYKGDFDKEHSFLSHSSERFFHERPYLDHKSYLMLTLPPAGRKTVTSMFSSLLRKHIVPVETLDVAFAKTFEGVCAQFIKVLSDAGFVTCKRLEKDALVRLVNEYLVLDNDGVLRDVDFENGICVGEKHCQLFTLGCTESLPAYCGARIDYEKYSSDGVKFPIGFASPLGQLLGCDHIYNQYIVIEDAALTMKKLESKKRRLQSLSAYSRENSIACDAMNQYLNEAVTEQRIPVMAHYNVLAWGDDVQDVRNLCTAALVKIDATAKIETVGAPQLFWAGIPGNAADLPINDAFLSFAEQACCFLNLETNYRSSLSPFGLRLGDRTTGRPVHVDISDEPMQKGITQNRSKFIVGPSGSGKSFFTNHFLRSYHEQGAHIVMVDVGHSYKGLCDLLGGYYFTYSQEQRLSFNPFQLDQPGQPDTEKKESIKTLLITLWKKDIESFSRSEYVTLSNALQLYYEKEIAFRSFDSFYEFLQREYAAVLTKDNVREKDFDLPGFLYVLRPFYKDGEYDYLLNATENLDLINQRFIVFELDTIKDHSILFPIVTIIIMEMFVSKIRRLKGIRKVILIEEAWKAIAKAGMAEYIRYLYKTIRKHFGEPVVVTQEIDDIISSEIVKKTIVAMSDCKILFDQSKYQQQFKEIQELLGLTEKDKALVLSLNKSNEPGRKYKEVFISLGGRISKVYRVEVSPEEYLTYTTEEKEKLAVTMAAEKYGSMEAGIKSIVHETK